MIIYTTLLVAKVTISPNHVLAFLAYFICADMYAYILDTGIYTEHQEFEGRAVRSMQFAP